MKNKKLKKLSLNKVTIAKLINSQMQKNKGGEQEQPPTAKQSNGPNCGGN